MLLCNIMYVIKQASKLLEKKNEVVFYPCSELGTAQPPLVFITNEKNNFQTK